MKPEVGEIVFDRTRDLLAVVCGVDGVKVTLRRPFGAVWKSSPMAVRPATSWERRQFKALGKFRANQLRGIFPR